MTSLNVYQIDDHGEIYSDDITFPDPTRLWNSLIIDKHNNICIIDDHAKYLRNKYNIEYDAKVISQHSEIKCIVFIEVVTSLKRIYYAGSRVSRTQYATLEMMAIEMEYELYRVNAWYWHITRTHNPTVSESEFVELIHRLDVPGVTTTRLMYSPPELEN